MLSTDFVDINYLAVLIAAIAAMAIGALWYSPALFGKLWMQLSGITPENIAKAKAKGMAKNYFIAFLGTLVMSYVLAHFVDYADVFYLAEGLKLGFWVWLGFMATRALGGVLWEGKPVKLYLLNAGHDLISILIMAAILSVWV